MVIGTVTTPKKRRSVTRKRKTRTCLPIDESSKRGLEEADISLARRDGRVRSSPSSFTSGDPFSA